MKIRKLANELIRDFLIYIGGIKKIMGKYFFYVVAAFIIAFTLNFFNIVSIPWLDVPLSLEDKEAGADKTKKTHDAVKEALGDK